MDYRIVHYAVSGWQIKKKWVVDTGPRTGKTDWVHWKYPSTLEMTAQALLNCLIDEKEYETVQELIDTVKKAEKNILEHLEEIVGKVK